MITGPHDALPVRPAATTSGNALWRLVRRISVGTLVICAVPWAISTGIAADAKKDDGAIRIVPATKSHRAPPPAPMIDQMDRGRTAKPPAKEKTPAKAESSGNLPPLPAPPATVPAKGRQQAGQLRILPAHRGPVAPNVLRYEQIYRSIPYSRAAYELDPMYRQVLALSLLLNQFPPAPTIMSPGSSGMGPGGSMSPHRGDRRFGSQMNYGPPMMPPGIVPEF
ncbi:MAG TPA: hypothetical protein VMR25_12420 [Planctomycetaceae bacterium]|jgi:hypothetical protein|nr:hypothetical protein [Planctomycetaceae bacterium]